MYKFIKLFTFKHMFVNIKYIVKFNRNVIIMKKLDKIIFHIDVNSAFLSWTAIDLIQKGESNKDIRKIPSIIGGNSKERRGVVLAKSIPAKKYNILTGEPISNALKKCPNLEVYEPNHKLYREYSNAMYNLLKPYSDYIERYSIDEVFMDMTYFKDNYEEKAEEIKNKIQSELGFAVNVGIGDNKLLAKMASDFTKKNSVHVLFKSQIKDKMWPLPVGRLFMVGKTAERKLNELNIITIEDLAKYDLNILKSIFKSYGVLIYSYANGIDESPINEMNHVDVKGIGNSTTTEKDIISRREAVKTLLLLTESVTKRLREKNLLCSVIAVSIKTRNFITYSHQRSIYIPTDNTSEIYKLVVQIFDEFWKGEPIRLLGVRVCKLTCNNVHQQSIFDDEKNEKERKLDQAIDSIRNKYGELSIIRSVLLKNDENNEVKDINLNNKFNNPWE